MKARKLFRWTSRVFLIVTVLGAIAAYFFLDSAPPDDADLRVPGANAPDSENGAAYLAEAEGTIYWPDDPVSENDASGENEEEAGHADSDPRKAADGETDDDADEASTPPTMDDRLMSLVRGDGWDAELADDVLTKNRELLERFEKSLEMERFELPPIVDSRASLLPAMRIWRKCTYIASIRIWERHAALDQPGSLRAALQVLRFGDRCENAGGPVIEYFVGDAIKSIAIDNLRRLLPRMTLDPEAWKEWIRRVQGLEPRPSTLHAAIRGEYSYACLYLDEVDRGARPLIDTDFSVFGDPPQTPIWPWCTRPFFLPNSLRRIACEITRDALKAVPVKGAWQRVDWQPFIDLEPNRWFPGRNGIGRHGVSSVVSAHRSAIERYESSWYALRFLRLSIALRAFQVARGSLPARLDELVPEWISEVPLDPASGTPFSYDAQRRLLWCAGSDGVDARGSFTPDADPDKIDLTEPTAKLPFD